ncbi:hypothetical protein ABPG77_001202 [Micractinium sp. CCAP 211/92]
MATGPAAATAKDQRGMTPLHRAAKTGQAEAAAALLEAYAGRDAARYRLPDGSTPLALAADGGHFEAAAALLRGAPDTALVADHEYRRPFARAQLAGHEELAAWLLEPAGPLPPGMTGVGHMPAAVRRAAQRAATAPLGNRLTPLGHAARRGDCQVAALLLCLGLASPSQQGDQVSGYNALQLAVVAGQEAMVSLLLQADPPAAELPTKRGLSPLHLAATHGHSKVVAQLLEAVPDAAEVAAPAGTPLLLAVRDGHADVAAQLMVACPRACLMPCGPQGFTPLHQAVWLGNAALASALLRAVPSAAEVRSVGADRATPLALAASHGNAELVQLLLEAAPHTAELTESSGLLPLHRALSSPAEAGTKAAVAALLGAAPAVAARRLSDGSTALHLAAHQAGSVQHRPAEDEDFMQALLAAAPAAATLKDRGGYLPIHWVALWGCRPALRVLIEAAAATAAQRTASGVTPLMMALGVERAGTRRCPEVVATLLAAAPDAAAVADAWGCVPLHLAASRDFAAAVPLLVAAAPATAAAVTPAGKTALHLAAEGGKQAAALALLAAAPQVACLRDSCGRTALLVTTMNARGHIGVPPCAAAEELAVVMAAAPPAACFERKGADGVTTLEDALQWRCIPLVKAFVTVQLAAGQPPAQLLGQLSRLRWGDRQAQDVLLVQVAAHARLTPEDWQQIPAPTHGLGAALPAVLHRSVAEAGLLVGRLPWADRRRLRCAALCLSRASRRRLHPELAASVLALSATDPERTAVKQRPGPTALEEDAWHPALGDYHALDFHDDD